MPAGQPSPQVQVFLAYAREDYAAVSQLYDRLEAAGIKPWMDKRDLLPGERWEDRVLRTIRASNMFVACLSTTSVAKRGFLQKEFKTALDMWQQKLVDDIYLVPLRLDECDVPEAFHPFHWADYFEEDGWGMLLRAIETCALQLGLPMPSEILEVRERELEAQRLREMITRVTEKITAQLIRIPAGEFLMGSDKTKDKGAYGDEQPQHLVRLDEFYIGKYPVTNAQYAAFVQAKEHRAPDHWNSGRIPTGKEQHPVVFVSWHDAVAFCQWLTEATGREFRLPSEAEWEKAASWDAEREQKRIYPWDDEFDASKCNTWESEKGGATEVGAYSPAGDSPYGIADMAGNVWEWTSSLRKEYPYDPNDGREDLTISGRRVLRGGSWYHDARLARCAYRGYNLPYARNDYNGFRVCVSPSL